MGLSENVLKTLNAAAKKIDGANQLARADLAFQEAFTALVTPSRSRLDGAALLIKLTKAGQTEADWTQVFDALLSAAETVEKDESSWTEVSSDGKAWAAPDEGLVLRMGARRRPGGEGLVPAVYAWTPSNMARWEPGVLAGMTTAKQSGEKKGSWSAKSLLPGSGEGICPPVDTGWAFERLKANRLLKGFKTAAREMGMSGEQARTAVRLAAGCARAAELPAETEGKEWWKERFDELDRPGLRDHEITMMYHHWQNLHRNILGQGKLDKNAASEASAEATAISKRLAEKAKAVVDALGAAARGKAGTPTASLRKWMEENGAGEAFVAAEKAWASPTARSLNFCLASPKATAEAATQCGAHGLLALVMWRGLGLDERTWTSGNEMLAAARATWRALGLSEAGWKMVGKMPLKVISALGLADEMAAAGGGAKEAEARRGVESWSRMALEIMSEGGRMGLSADDVSKFLLTTAPEAVMTGGGAASKLGNGLMANAGLFCETLLAKLPEEKVETKEQARAFMIEAEEKERRLPFVRAEVVKRLARMTEGREGSELAARKAEFAEEASRIDDWLRGSEGGVWGRMPERPTWGSLTKGQRDWHEEVAVNGSKTGSKSGGWRRILGTLGEGDWRATELLTGAALMEEGRALHHCVSSYAGRCRSGKSAIFSITHNGQKKSTLELTQYKDKAKDPETGDEFVVKTWRVNQHSGACNARVSEKGALELAEEVLKAVRERELELALKKRREARAAKKKAGTKA